MKFRHIYLSDHNENPMPVATICSVQHEGAVRFAMARCNTLDQFAKRTGRRISQGRLEKCKSLTGFASPFTERLESLFNNDCALFTKEEIPDLLKALKKELSFRHDKTYRELAQERSI